MIWTLVAKDMLRFRRNWVTVAIMLAVPLALTGLIGITFGPSARDGEMPRIKVALVDEDDSILGSMLAGSVASEQASKYFDAAFEDRETALGMLNENQISVVVVVPSGFTDALLDNRVPAPIELVKNPAQRYMPAVVEELLSLLVEALNAISQNLMSELPELIEVFEEEGAPDSTKLTTAITRIGKKFEQAEGYLFPPLITYGRETVASTDQGTGGVNLFAYLLPGMAAMFLLFIADGTAQEIYRENEARTLARFRTVRYHVFPFVASKGLYAMTIVLLSALILFVGGGVIFRIRWQHPAQVLVLVTAFCVFCVGFIGLLTAIMMSEKRAAMFNSVLIMLMAFLAGNIMPVNELPGVLRDTVSRWIPNYWFHQAVLRLEFGMDGPHWLTATVALLLAGGTTLWISSVLFTRRLAAGLKT